MSDDDLATLLLALSVAFVIAPIALAGLLVGAIGAIGYGAFRVLRAGYRAIAGPPARRELKRAAADRDAAIQEMMAIRRGATRRMVEIAKREDVIDVYGYEIKELAVAEDGVYARRYLAHLELQVRSLLERLDEIESQLSQHEVTVEIYKALFAGAWEVINELRGHSGAGALRDGG